MDPKWKSAPYVALLLQVLLVLVVAVGFVIVFESQAAIVQQQTSIVSENRRIGRCILRELENHRGRSERVYGAFADGNGQLQHVLNDPPASSACLYQLDQE